MKNRLSRKTLNLILISLIVLVVLTTVLSGNLLAKYATSAEPNIQTARVAKFKIDTVQGVSEYSRDITAENIKPGDTFVQPIQVENNSEVAVECTLTAIKTSNLPIVFKVGGELMDPPIIRKKIPIGGDAFKTELVIEWPIEANDSSYSMMVDAVKLNLSVVQVD